MYKFTITGYVSPNKNGYLYNSSKPVDITVLANTASEAIDKAEKVLGEYISMEYRKVVVEELPDDKRVEELEYILQGVMHSVDKWLEGDDFDHDEVNRAAIMREKTLQIVEARDAHIRALKADLKGLAREREILEKRIEELQEYIRRGSASYEKRKTDFEKIHAFLENGQLPPLKEE